VPRRASLVATSLCANPQQDADSLPAATLWVIPRQRYGFSHRLLSLNPYCGPAGQLTRTISRGGRGEKVASPGITLPRISTLLAVTAHPDDESFGLGAVLATFAREGTHLALLCFTMGERSTLGPMLGDLRSIRRAEMDLAAAVLGIEGAIVLGYPDGRLDEESVEELTQHIVHAATDVDALLVFDEGGITGHPDHRAATRAALAAAQTLDLPVLAWTIPPSVADALNAEYGSSFVPREAMEQGFEIEVDRTLQLKAIACHRSQCTDNPVLWRRLELQGTREYLMWLWVPEPHQT
jgi:LmbE family N-acetylglucosaminyl deacetylase